MGFGLLERYVVGRSGAVDSAVASAVNAASVTETNVGSAALVWELAAQCIREMCAV